MIEARPSKGEFSSGPAALARSDQRKAEASTALRKAEVFYFLVAQLEYGIAVHGHFEASVGESRTQTGERVLASLDLIESYLPGIRADVRRYMESGADV